MLSMAKLAAFFVLVLGMALTVTFLQEHSYQTKTPPEVKAQHIQIAKELATLNTGDFVEMNNKLVIVAFKSSDGKYIRLREAYASKSDEYEIEEMSRKSPKITRMPDPSWSEKMKIYMNLGAKQ